MKICRRHVILFGLVCVSVLAASLINNGCAGARKNNRGGYFVLRWIEKPVEGGPSAQAKPEDVVRFEQVIEYERDSDDETFKKVRDQIREGDLIAFRMNKSEARKHMITGGIGKICYRLCEYGHLAIIVKDPKDPTRLRVFSSYSFKGPNTEEDLDTLKSQCWDIYRMDKWERVDTKRLDEFVKLSIEKAGNWRGYDFSGIFGLWNSETKPTKPKEIGHDYICSTIVIAALSYSGVQLDAVHRDGVMDIITPKQVVTSKGHITTPRDVAIEVERFPK